MNVIRMHVIFWAGSVVNNQGTTASDLDLVIVYEELPNAFREAFIFDEWPIDAFVHTIGTLRYFFEESKNGSGISGLIQMILHGREITEPSPFSKHIKTLAEQFLQKGPIAWNKEKMDTERFLITDLLEDIEFPKTRTEQIASTASLYDLLAQFYFRSQNKWSASGKSIARYLELDNPALAQNFTESFECVFKTGNITHLKQLTQKILQPYGGFLWEGYKSNASKTAKIADMKQTIYNLETSLLSAQIRQSCEQLNKLIADDFMEFGSSGKIYNKNDVMESLPTEDTRKFTISCFEVKELSKDVMLATYKAVENGAVSLRSSVWRLSDDIWQMVFHQGTIVPETEHECTK